MVTVQPPLSLPCDYHTTPPPPTRDIVRDLESKSSRLGHPRKNLNILARFVKTTSFKIKDLSSGKSIRIGQSKVTLYNLSFASIKTIRQ
jgi:hypothetical protein